MGCLNSTTNYINCILYINSLFLYINCTLVQFISAIVSNYLFCIYLIRTIFKYILNSLYFCCEFKSDLYYLYNLALDNFLSIVSVII
jgi:hypothetical protein